MEVRIASEASPDHAINEDFAFAVPGFVGVLDGVSVPEGLDTGCLHGAAWYVRRLAARLTAAYVGNPGAPMAQHLARAIEAVRGDHDGRCDLAHPGTPAGTVCLLRKSGHQVEYLVLCDSPLVVERGGQVQVVTDERFDRAVADLRAVALTGHAAIGSTEHSEQLRHTVTEQRRKTNRPGGYWIAAANPDAAYQAITGSLPLIGPDRVRRAALLTDGASCAVDRFALMDWRGLLDVLTDDGPQELIARVRAAERADNDGHDRPRYKRHDDATAALCLFEKEPS